MIFQRIRRHSDILDAMDDRKKSERQFCDFSSGSYNMRELLHEFIWKERTAGRAKC